MRTQYKNKLVSLLLVLMMTFGFVGPASGAFNDISGHWAEQDMLKMEARGVIRGDGAGNFFPEEFISRQEVVALLVGLVGQQGAAANLAGGDTTRISSATGISDWAKGFMLYAWQAGIVAPGEWGTQNWSGPAQRQEVAIWLSKAIKLLPVVVDNEKILARFLDGNQVDLMKSPFIIPLIQDGIIKGSNGYFYPLQPIKRAEVVAMLSRADTRYVTPTLQRSQQGRIASYTTWPNQNVTITNSLGQTLNFGVTASTAIYKNRIRATLTALAVGESIDYVSDGKNNLIYLESASVLINPVNPVSSYNPNPNTSTYSTNTPIVTADGKVQNIDWYSGYVEMDINGSWKRFTLSSSMMNEYKISSSFRRDAPRIGDWAKITSQNGVASRLQILKAYNDGEEVIVYKGTLDAVDDRRNRITLDSGTVYIWSGSSWRYKSGTKTIDFDSSTDCYYGDNDIDLDDLSDYRNRTVYVACLEDGDEAEKIRVIRGSQMSFRDDIWDLNSSYDEFKLDSGRTISYDDSTIFIYKGDLADDGDLEEDIEVRGYTDRVGSDYYASLVEIGELSSSSNSDDLLIYRALLNYVDTNDEEIVIKSGSLQRLDEDGDWNRRSRSLTMALDSRVELYYGDEDIDLDDLYRYDDDTIYMIYDEDEDEIIHLRVREYSEIIYVDKIYSLSNSYEHFELRNHSGHIYWDDDTIFIDDEELFYGDDLKEGDDVVVIVDDGNKEHAAIVLRR